MGGSSRSPPQGHRQHRWQRCDISGRLRGGECGFGPCGCVCSGFEGHGRLQCLCRVGEPIRSEQTVFDRECIGRKCGGQGFLRVQGCSQGCAAVRRARRACAWTCSPQVCCCCWDLSATKQREDVEQSERLRAAVCIVLEFWLMDAVCPYVQSLSFAQ